MSKYIFVTGGVVSSLGKGILVSGLGTLLETIGYKVSLQKIDPYLNIDAGTMSPFEHGEVYVTDDGAEADLDLGNYERFTNAAITRNNLMTTGSVYHQVLRKERRGDYLGKTVQIIPHVTDEIKRRISLCAEQSEADIAIIEVGGTVGDIESIPFLEAIRQMAREQGRDNVAYVHLTLAPYLTAADEVKSKPTQHSVRELRAAGLYPNIIICRSQNQLNQDIKRKISLFCDVEEDAVISVYNAKYSVYEIPEMLEKEGLTKVLLKALNLPEKTPNLTKWHNITKVIRSEKETIKIAFAGKYIEHKDAYKSVYEALDHAAIANHLKLEIIRINSEELAEENSEAWALLKSTSGLLVPGGFGERGVEGKILAIEYARTHDIPFFGICLGMQCMAIEFARNVLKLEGSNSVEFVLNALNPIINLMEEQKVLSTLGGTMRLGSFPAWLAENSLAYKAYGQTEISERHRHRYEFNNKYRAQFEEAGVLFSGINKKLGLVEIMEIPAKRWFLGGQFHPEFHSKPFAAHPLFRDFIAAAKTYHDDQPKS